MFKTRLDTRNVRASFSRRAARGLVRVTMPLALAAAAACDETSTAPEVPFVQATQSGFAVPFFVQAAGGGAAHADGTLIHEIRTNAPIMDPAGQQLTLEAWNRAGGSITVACTSGGTRVTAQWTGLIPSGVYTMWSVVLRPGFDGTLEGLMGSITGLGAMGARDGSQNTFVADADGNATVDLVQPGGALSMIGSIGSCALDEYEYHVVASYHIDGMSWGPDLGPDGSAVEHAGAIFKGGEAAN